MSKNNNKPEILKLSSKDIDNIQARLLENSLNAEDKKIMLAILTTYQWLCNQLQMAKFSIHKLKSVFGFKTEKKSKLKNSQLHGSSNISTELKKNEQPSNTSSTTSNDAEGSPLKKQ